MRLKDHISSDSLLRKLGINNIQTLLRYNRLRWFGHVVRNDGCINNITEFESGHFLPLYQWLLDTYLSYIGSYQAQDCF